MSLFDRKERQKEMVARTFRDTCDLYQPVVTKGDAGENIETFGNATKSDIKCACQGNWGYERKIQNQVKENYEYYLYMEWTTEVINAKDHIVVNDVTYEVKTIDRESFKDVYQEVKLLMLA